jgi:hypothetical protein
MGKKLSESTLTAILQAQKADTLAAISSSKLSAARSDAMDYYNGNMQKDMPTLEGRSRAVSTDVSDTVEGLMPSLMDIFFGGDDVVRFMPTGPNDVQSAEQESDYVNHVFTELNPGFLVMYSFIKDALLQKNGIVKCFWDEEEREDRDTYYDLTDDQFAFLAAEKDIEIVEHTVKDYPGNTPDPQQEGGSGVG